MDLTLVEVSSNVKCSKVFPSEENGILNAQRKQSSELSKTANANKGDGDFECNSTKSNIGQERINACHTANVSLQVQMAVGTEPCVGDYQVL